MAGCIMRCILLDCPWGNAVHGGGGGCCPSGWGGGGMLSMVDAVNGGMLSLGGCCQWGDAVNGQML